MLVAYFDESGTDDRAKVLTVAGYLSTVARWKKFEDEWQALLDAEGLEYFHAVEMAHFRGEFKEWDAVRRRTFEEQAHKIIRDNVMKPFDVSLFWADYLELIPQYKGKDAPPAYACLVNSILLLVGKWATENKRFEPIHYVFERGIDSEGWVSKTYAKASNDIEAGGAFHFASLTFAEGKKEQNGIKPLVQLQAADLHVYEIRKNREDVLSGRVEREGKVRGSLLNLRHDDRELHIYDRKALAFLLDEIAKNDPL